MRTFNVRPAAVGLVVLAIAFAGLQPLDGFQYSPQAEALKAAAARAEKDKNLDEAIRALETHVGLAPKDRKAQLHLGLLYAEKRDARHAFITLEEVLRTADGSIPKKELYKARRKLVDMAMLIGRPQDAEAHLAILRKEISNDPELLDLDGQNLVGNNQDHEACEQFREAIKLRPPRSTPTSTWRTCSVRGWLAVLRPTRS